MTNVSWLERLKAVECRDSTYRPVASPLVLERGSGSKLVDVEGREYIDLCAGFGALALGHNPAAHQRLWLDRLESPTSGRMPPLTHGLGDVYASRSKIELIEALVGILPDGYDKVALAVTGGQAVETAVKTAVLATKRAGFITFDSGYHGVDIGVLPLTSRADFKDPFSAILRTGHVVRLPFGCDEDRLRTGIKSLEGAGCGFAGIVVEPVQGRAGARSAPPGWLACLRAVCDTSGAVLIFDEVYSGMGRAGRITFGDEVRADLLCLGKALGGGHPISACVGSEAIMQAWPESSGEAIHTGTFFGHPLSCAAAVLTIEAVQKEDLVTRTKEVGNEAVEYLKNALAKLSSAYQVRGLGFVIAIDLGAAGAGVIATDRLREDGIVAIPCGDRGECIAISPAFNIPKELFMGALGQTVRLIARHSF